MKTTLLLAVAVAAFAAASAATVHAASPAASVVVPKCPSHAPKFASKGLPTSHFVRANAQYVRLCRYYKVNWADSQGLWRQRVVHDRPTISYLTHGFNALKEPPRGIFCVRDDGSEMLVIFAYSGPAPERVVVKLSGCRFVSNGKATRSLTRTLHNRLTRLTNP